MLTLLAAASLEDPIEVASDEETPLCDPLDTLAIDAAEDSDPDCEPDGCEPDCEPDGCEPDCESDGCEPDCEPDDSDTDCDPDAPEPDEPDDTEPDDCDSDEPEPLLEDTELLGEAALLDEAELLDEEPEEELSLLDELEEEELLEPQQQKPAITETVRPEPEDIGHAFSCSTTRCALT